MKILLSCVPFDHGKSGISVYLRNLVAALTAQGHDITLMVEADATEAFPTYPKVILPNFCRKPLWSMLYHLFVLPFRLHFKEFDMVILGAANRRAFCRYPVFTAAVVHDLSQYHVPAKYDVFRMFYIKWLLPHYVRKAQAVVAISQATAMDLRDHWKIPPDRLHVIYNGVSSPPSDSETAQPWLHEHGIRRPFILYISRLEHPGKNHRHLIEAFSALPPEVASQFDLLLPGAPWNGAEEILQAAKNSPYADHIHCVGYVQPELLPALYRTATCYVFPSFAEGFGLSLIEAMQYGVPCACSNTTALGELGEGAALLFDPNRTEEIAHAINELLTSPETREKLRQKGLQRAKEFSWENTARAFGQLDRRPRVFGVPCDNVTMEQALERLDELVHAPGTAFAAYVNAHCLNVSCKDAEYCAILNRADAVWPDGAGVRLAGRIKGFPVPSNVNGTDMFPLLCQRPYRIFLLGGAPGVAEQAMAKAHEKYPTAQFVGAASGFFADETEERQVIDQINALRPDILLVALGVPLQEKWIDHHRTELNCGVALAVGGLLDFVSGRIPRAPKWLRRLGLEWCYRLCQEPKRLFKRYIIGNPLFVLRLLFGKR
ncbi:MAG: WecB/TagA/CpsF family glycosyltransferase [Victivallales bacterium]|nr:WecB/TagA/CpsF family glycosyltransferase [Victivallales bacterium]